MKKLIVSTLIIASTIVACKTAEKSTTTAPPPLDCTTKSLAFTTDIKPVFDTYCTRCHNTNEKGGYNFQELSFIKKAASNGNLLGTIKHQKGFPHMPANAEPLSADVIAKIECWINNGMKE